MKSIFLSALFFSFAFAACFVFDFEEGNQSRTNKNNSTTQIQNYAKNAVFDVSNLLLMRKPEDYLGKVISLSGSLVEQVYVADKETWVEIRGKTGDRGFDLMVHLDHPLPVQKNIGEDITTISTGSQVRMLAKFRGFEDFTDEYGSKRKLPVAECVAIFLHKDINLIKPVWIWHQ